MSGEVVEREAPVARVVSPPSSAVGPASADGPFYYGEPRVIVIERPVDPVPFEEEPGIRWDRLGAYMFGVGMLLVVLLALALAGVLDLHAVHPPWQTGR